MLWFLPLATVLATENLNNLSDKALLLFRAYAELQRIIDANEKLSTLDEDGSSNRNFLTSTGWRVTVFDDCGEFDYIDNMCSPDGKDLCIEFGWDYLEQHGTIYAPTSEQLTDIWQWEE